MKTFLKSKSNQEKKMLNQYKQFKEKDEFYFDKQILKDSKYGGFLSEEESKILKTTIQWLGTEEGIIFLNKCGFSLETEEK